MRTRVFLIALLVTACSPDRGRSPDDVEHGYIVFNPKTQDSGWAIIDAMNHELPATEKAKVRTAGLVASDKPTMFVDFTGSCTRDRDFLSLVRQIAARLDQAGLECSAKPPTAF